VLKFIEKHKTYSRK